MASTKQQNILRSEILDALEDVLESKEIDMATFEIAKDSGHFPDQHGGIYYTLDTRHDMLVEAIDAYVALAYHTKMNVLED